MATITSAGTGNWNTAGTWDSGVPGTGDDVIIADGHAVTLDTGTNSIRTLTAAGNTGYVTLGSSVSLTTSNGVTYAGTSTSGFIRVTGGTLTLASNVTNNSTGRAVMVTGTASLTLVGNLTQGAANGYVVYCNVSSTNRLQLTGNIGNAGGVNALYWQSTQTNSTWTGGITACSAGQAVKNVLGTLTWTPSGTTSITLTDGIGVWVSGGTLVLAGLPSCSLAATAVGKYPIWVGAAGLTITAPTTFAAGKSCLIGINGASTLTLASASAALSLSNAGSICFLIENAAATTITTTAAGGTAKITNTGAGQCTFIGSSTAQGIVSSPSGGLLSVGD